MSAETDVLEILYVRSLTDKLIDKCTRRPQQSLDVVVSRAFDPEWLRSPQLFKRQKQFLTVPERNDLLEADSASRFGARVCQRAKSHLVLSAVYYEDRSANLIRIIHVRKLIAYAGESKIEGDSIRREQRALKYDAGHASSI